MIDSVWAAFVEVGARPDFENKKAIRVFRSDAGVAHRLSLSARLLYMPDRRVKPKRSCKTTAERLLRPAESASGPPRKQWSGS